MRKASQARHIRLHSVTKQKMAEVGSKMYFRVAFISLLLSLASGDCVDLDLGMENGTILDSEITASSKKDASTPAENGRLNYTLGSSWCAGSGSNPYLQIDLLTLHIICAVSTQGNSQADQWVKTYTLKISKDGSSSSWTDYKEDGLVKTFEGNNDRNSEVKHVLYKVLARYLRIQPKTHHGHVCMRTEVFGVKIKPENLAHGKSTAQSSIYNYNSTVTGVSRNAVDGNADTDFQNGHCSHTNATNPSWWRVDLGTNLVPVSEIFIVNRFSSLSSLQQRNIDYKITLGSSSDVTRNDECEGVYSFVNFKASAVCFMNPLITGRYVGIMTTKSQILQLCEVEVYSRENLAFGKPTFQSGTTYKNGKSSKAVDGNSNTHLQRGEPAGSCTMTRLTNNPWWRVDLQQVQYVSEVYIVNRGSECGCPNRFKNFEIRVGMVDDGQSSANPKCGDTYTYPFPVGEGRSFFCHPSLKGKNVIIRFVNRNDPLTLCEVEVYSERRACPMQAIGVASSDAFPDDSFSASSTSGSNKAFKGRLNGDGAWLPSNNNNADDYLEIDLGYEFVICAVATQGNPSAYHWTTKYKLQLALIDLANNWLTYQENSIDKEFNGNSGRRDIVKHSLKEYASARFIRFQPTTYNNHKALRVEVYGILISAVPSQPPSGFTVTAITSTSITASWQLPPKYARHGIITGFKLFYAKKASQGSPTVLTNNVTSLSRVFSLLDNYTDYEFQVLAFSSKGDGPKSPVLVVRTKEDVPSGPPANFNVTAITSTSIIASWELPPADDRNGIITGFKLFYKKKDSLGSQTMEAINSGSIRNKVVTGLDEYTEYEFQVLAYTSVGDGPKSSKKYERTNEDAPSSAPSGFALTANTSTSITASWQLPPADDRNGIITGFKLFYKKKGSSVSLTMVLVNSGSIRTKVVSGLDKYTEYEFQVLAYTSSGDGPKSSVKYETTMEDAPSKAPSNFSVTAKTSTTIQASWQLPTEDDRNGVIKGFKLFYKKKSSSGSQTMIPVKSGSTLTKVFTGLDEYAEYEFQVLAYTSKGDGPKSNSKSATTKEAVPSGPPANFNVTAITSTSVTASWELPPADDRNGIITGFKLFYKKKDSLGSQTIEAINSGSIRNKVVTGLDKYTEFEFQVLAYTSVGDGPKSYKKYERTKEDAPSIPTTLTTSVLDPDESHGPRIKLTWTIPAEPNGVIKSYTVFYSCSGNSQKEISGIDALNYSVDVLGGVKYQFYVGAVTIKPGPNASSSVNVPEYRPSIAPPNVSFAGINKTAFKISWALLAREKSYGNVILYDVKEEFLSRGKQQKRSSSDRTFNTTATFVVLYDLLLCSQYRVSVRAYTKAGPGPYSQPMVLETSKPEAPSDFKATNFGSTEVTLDWTKPKVTTKEGLSYTVKFSGTKSYNKEFKDEGIKAVGKSTTCTVVGLVPGSNYNFEIYGTSVCGESLSLNLKVDTNSTAPIAPVVLNLTDVTVSVTVVGIYLWPVEQRNGPISAYQVIVLKVVDGAKELPDDYDSKLKGANNTNKGILNFYIAAEIPNVPVYKESWKFNVGDGNIYGGLVNKGLEAGEEYVIFQRAVTRDNNTILGGEASRVAKISIIPEVDITRNTSAVVNVTEGESLTVNCSIGTDDPFWSRKDGGDVDTKTRKRDGVLLRIENASIADTGVYVCKHGKDQHTIWIQVLVQVEVEMELVVENYVFTEELKNKSSPEYKETEKNFTIEMDKVHRGVTPGYVRTDVLGFKKGSVQVDFKIVIVLVTNDPENETDLPDVKAETAQRVVVKAKTGFVERLQVKKVIVKTVPLEPANVEFFGIDSDELSVRWNPSEDADSFQVQRYEVHYRKFEEKLFTNVSQPASDGKTQYTIRIQPLEPETTYMIQVGAANDYGRNFNDESAHKTDPAPFAWWIIVVVVFIVLLVLVILVVLIVYKRKRDREREALQQGPRIDALELESAKHEIAAAESKNVKGLSYSYHNDAYKPSEVSWEEIPYENLKLLDELGSGAFGVVYKAEYLQENGNVLPCAVKSLKPSASSQEVHDLYNELEIMDNVGYHPNLVNLIGACTEDGHLLVVLEIAENGSLIEFLKKNRQTDQSNEIISGLTEQMKTRVATDVARGMAHLAKCRCIHRDLAARNVLLGKDYVAKVSDYGMARDVYEDLMYKKETQGKLPVKWMAIESLQTYIFTIESDVWSYGVLLWEIESGGLKPYAGLNTTELMEELKKGYRLEKPAGCSEDMYQVMRSCWNPNPSARPTFDQLVIQLESEIVT